MTDNGHCDHCGETCRRGHAGRAHLRTAGETDMAWAATWLDGRCPFCKERARCLEWVDGCGCPDCMDAADGIRHGRTYPDPPTPEQIEASREQYWRGRHKAEGRCQ